ncbi:ras-related protein Rab-23 [Aethina tumida]|uniref:ras-related protein Rab-23 n=1 Tax=Aethina tumida TaxID=116153 RepID=UPI0021481626|nr:ras-related protein Rab-23 [Aethina tumida]
MGLTDMIFIRLCFKHMMWVLITTILRTRVDGEDVRLMLWDTAGQEEFDAITKAYYRGAQACVLAFSTTDRDSFEAAHSWKLKVENECGEIPTVIVQNKIDLMDQSVVNPSASNDLSCCFVSEEAELLARALGCRLLRTSVKEDVNVAAVFRHLAAKCLQELRDPRDDYFTSPTPHHPNSLTISKLSILIV